MGSFPSKKQLFFCFPGLFQENRPFFLPTSRKLLIKKLQFGNNHKKRTRKLCKADKNQFCEKFFCFLACIFPKKSVD